MFVVVARVKEGCKRGEMGKYSHVLCIKTQVVIIGEALARQRGRQTFFSICQIISQKVAVQFYYTQICSARASNFYVLVRSLSRRRTCFWTAVQRELPCGAGITKSAKI